MSKDKGIPLSPKHGVNPTLAICFYCGEHTGEIALLGKLKDDAQAPKEAVIDYRPCKECQEKFSKGVLIIAVRPSNNKHRYIAPGYEPTGAYAVIRPEAIKIDTKPGDMKLMLQNEFEQLFNSK